MGKLFVGINDLATLHPEVAAEADGWDPSTVTVGSSKKFTWKCAKGHDWESTPYKRALREDGCPYCANQKVWVGFNDLKTKFPEIAKEANGWDPATVVAGSNKKMSWKCKEGHEWKTSSNKRTCRGDNCPFCSNKRLWSGFNDLKTRFPKIAKEANGWDPAIVMPGSTRTMSWKCAKGHSWQAKPNDRTGTHKTNCPICSDSGFNPEKIAWFYLMERENEQQFGITNNLEQRMRVHYRSGWVQIDVTDAHDGKEIQKIERKFKKWLKQNIGLVPDKQENWYKSKMEVSSLAELKEKSGIKTSLF